MLGWVVVAICLHKTPEPSKLDNSGVATEPLGSVAECGANRLDGDGVAPTGSG